MSIKRIDADLGSVSLRVAELLDAGIPVSPDQRSADGVRLRELLDKSLPERTADIPVAQDAQDGRPSRDQMSCLPHRLRWLAGLLNLASLSHEDLHGESVSLRVPADLLQDATLELRKTRDMLVFDLKIGDAAARAWACDKLVALADMLAIRIACPFSLRIVDAGTASVVAEAGKEIGKHPCH